LKDSFPNFAANGSRFLLCKNSFIFFSKLKLNLKTLTLVKVR